MTKYAAHSEGKIWGTGNSCESALEAASLCMKFMCHTPAKISVGEITDSLYSKYLNIGSNVGFKHLPGGKIGTESDLIAEHLSVL